MATPARDTIKVFVYIGGTIIQDGLSVSYDRSHQTIVRVRRDISFSDFLDKLYRRCGIDSEKYVLLVSGKISRWYQNQWREIVSEITSDNDLEIYLHPDEGNDSIDVFVESQPVYNPLMPLEFTTSEPIYSPQMPSQHAYNPNMPTFPSQPEFSHFDLNEPHNSFVQTNSELDAITQGLSTMGFEMGTSHQNLGSYIGESSGVRDTNVHYELPNDTRYYDIHNDNDLFGDTHGANVISDSEPSDPEDGENDGENAGENDGANDSENIETVDDIVQTLAQNREEIPSNSHANVNTSPFVEQPTQFYDPPSFYSMSFPEVIADSIDVPSGMWSKFYDSSSGILEKGMLFDNKARVVSAVRDHSIR